ncbi:MAG: hypothetical protein RL619_477 [Bacteroidota bacterium]|jgi:hypothetical protein
MHTTNTLILMIFIFFWLFNKNEKMKKNFSFKEIFQIKVFKKIKNLERKIFRGFCVLLFQD